MKNKLCAYGFDQNATKFKQANKQKLKITSLVTGCLDGSYWLWYSSKTISNEHQALNSGKCNFLLLSCKIDKHTELFHF